MFKKENGFTVVDIAISIVIITIFIAVIGNLIINININSKAIDRKTIATSYAVQEIEKIKAQGYLNIYEDKGIAEEEILEEFDIINSEGEFSGYTKKVTIKDYVFLKNDSTKQSNLVKEVKVEISYLLQNKVQNVTISTYIAKE